MKTCRHADRGPCKCPTAVDTPDYVGGESFPADIWGAAPLRGRLVESIEAFLTHKAILGATWTSGDLVDDLIAKGFYPNELKENGQ